MLGCTFLSMILLVAFNIICLKKFGLLSCYSAYGAKWGDWEKEHHFTNGLNIWSVITFLTAALLIPPMLTTSAGNPLQFLCFFAPVYLFLVAFTPYYTESKANNLIHQIGSKCRERHSVISSFLLFWVQFFTVCTCYKSCRLPVEATHTGYNIMPFVDRSPVSISSFGP